MPDIDDLINRPPPAELPSPKMRAKLRRGAGISQYELASALGVSRQTIISWEKGEKEPAGDNREQYAEFFRKLHNRAAARKESA